LHLLQPHLPIRTDFEVEGIVTFAVLTATANEVEVDGGCITLSPVPFIVRLVIVGL
jgi:hypothetical protein